MHTWKAMQSTPSSSWETDGCGSWPFIFRWKSISVVFAQYSCPLCSLSPSSGCSFTQLVACPGLSQESSPPCASIHLFWKSCKDSQDLYGVLSNTGRFSWTLFPFIKNLSGSLKEMPPIILNLHVCQTYERLSDKNPNKPNPKQNKSRTGWCPKHYFSLLWHFTCSTRDAGGVLVSCWQHSSSNEKHAASWHKKEKKKKGLEKGDTNNHRSVGFYEPQKRF